MSLGQVFPRGRPDDRLRRRRQPLREPLRGPRVRAGEDVVGRGRAVERADRLGGAPLPAESGAEEAGGPHARGPERLAPAGHDAVEGPAVEAGREEGPRLDEEADEELLAVRLPEPPVRLVGAEVEVPDAQPPFVVVRDPLRLRRRRARRVLRRRQREDEELQRPAPPLRPRADEARERAEELRRRPVAEEDHPLPLLLRPEHLQPEARRRREEGHRLDGDRVELPRERVEVEVEVRGPPDRLAQPGRRLPPALRGPAGPVHAIGERQGDGAGPVRPAGDDLRLEEARSPERDPRDHPEAHDPCLPPVEVGRLRHDEVPDPGGHRLARPEPVLGAQPPRVVVRDERQGAEEVGRPDRVGGPVPREEEVEWVEERAPSGELDAPVPLGPEGEPDPRVRHRVSRAGLPQVPESLPEPVAVEEVVAVEEGGPRRVDAREPLVARRAEVARVDLDDPLEPLGEAGGLAARRLVGAVEDREDPAARPLALRRLRRREGARERREGERPLAVEVRDDRQVRGAHARLARLPAVISVVSTRGSRAEPSIAEASPPPTRPSARGSSRGTSAPP